MSWTNVGMQGIAQRTGFDDFLHIAKRWEPLANYTSYKIGGTAELLFVPKTEEELVQLYQRCLDLDITPHILGGGCNLLIVSHLLPVVICTRALNHFSIEQDILHVEAGASLALLVRRTISSGLSGLQGLAGVPGTAGGALVGNAGGKSAIGDWVQQVRVLTDEGFVRELTREQVNFGYRRSNLNQYLVLGASLKLESAPVEVLQAQQRDYLHAKAQAQPLAARSAGCVFKNPPGYSAWRLISQAGLVGYRIGAAAISEKHANFIVNLGGASGEEVLELIEFTRRKVYQSTGIELELEIKVW